MRKEAWYNGDKIIGYYDVAETEEEIREREEAFRKWEESGSQTVIRNIEKDWNTGELYLTSEDETEEDKKAFSKETFENNVAFYIDKFNKIKKENINI